MAEDINLEFCMRIKSKKKLKTTAQKGALNISETGEGTNLKFCTWIEGKGPDTKQKCKTGKNESWSTSRSRDVLNNQAAEALKNGKIRESITFDFQHAYRMWTWFVNFLDIKSKY